MSLWDALILGIVEGITEYLPVSSTGHLLVAERFLGLAGSQAANAYAIVIQLGAILAVLRIYHARVRQLFRGALGTDAGGRRLGLSIAAAFLPAAVLGLAFDDLIEEHLFKPWPVVAAWIVGGIVILWCSARIKAREGRPLEALWWRPALLIGLCQCLALWPGVSRSLATILGGLAVGLCLPAAVEFSFLLGVVTLGAATAYSATKYGAVMVETYGIAALVVGLVASWVSAVLAVRWMVDWINQRGMDVFGYWRIVAGLAVAVLLLTGHF